MQTKTPCKYINMPIQAETLTILLMSLSQECKDEGCSELCIKDELGEDDDKKGKWTTLFARAPIKSDDCLEACFAGCQNKVDEDDD